jgi:hypothetical protein
VWPSGGSERARKLTAPLGRPRWSRLRREPFGMAQGPEQVEGLSRADLPDDGRPFDHGNDLHRAPAAGTDQWIDLVDLADQASSRAQPSGAPTIGVPPGALGCLHHRRLGPRLRLSRAARAACGNRAFHSNTSRKRGWFSRGHRGGGRSPRRGSPGERRRGFVASVSTELDEVSAERKLAWCRGWTASDR